MTVRNSQGRVRAAMVPVDESAADPDADRIAALSIAAVALLLLVVVVGPLRGLSRVLRSLVVRQAAGPSEVLLRIVHDGAARPVRVLAALLFFAAALFVVLALASTNVVLAAGLLCLVSVVSGAGEAKGFARLRGAAVGLLRAIPACAAAAIAAVRGASTSLEQLVAAQGAAPWHWEALSSPTSLLVLFLSASVICSGSTSAVPSPANAALRGLGGAMLACCLLGGWTADGELMGQLIFAAKGWLLGVCFPHGGKSSWIVVTALALTAAAATIALRVLPVPDWVPTAATWTAAAAALFVALPSAILWLLRSRVRIDPGVAQHPVASDRSPDPSRSVVPILDRSV